MASKKLTLLLGLICLFLSYADAQTVGSSYDIRDSSLIPTRRLAQHNEFLNNAYPFPAKPRNEWEIGVNGGYTYGWTSVTNWGPTGGFGFHVRKALGYVFSIRAEYDWIRLRGLNYQYTQSYGRNGQLTSIYAQQASGQWDSIFYNYRSTVHELSLQGVFTFNNINFHRAKTGFNWYIFGGIGAMTYSTLYKADPRLTLPDYETVINQFPTERLQQQEADPQRVEKCDDGEMEYDRRTAQYQQVTLGGAPLDIVGVTVIGAQFKLNDRLNIQVEDKVTLTTTRLLAGQQWQNNYTFGAIEQHCAGRICRPLQLCFGRDQL